MSRPKGRRSQCIRELHFVQLMVAAEERQHRLWLFALDLRIVDQRLDLLRRGGVIGRAGDKIQELATANRGPMA